MMGRAARMARRKWENPLDKMSRGFYNAVVRHQTSRACTAVKFMDRVDGASDWECCLHVCGLGLFYHGFADLSRGRKNFFFGYASARLIRRKGASLTPRRRHRQRKEQKGRRNTDAPPRVLPEMKPTKTAQNDQFWSAEKKAGKQVNFWFYFTSLFFNPRKGVASPLIDALSPERVNYTKLAFCVYFLGRKAAKKHAEENRARGKNKRVNAKRGKRQKRRQSYGNRQK